MSGISILNNPKRGKSIYQLMTNYGIIFCFLIVGCRIFLGKVIDDQGMGYLAVPMELYLITAYALAMPLSRTISVQMKVRIKKKQYRNALRIAGCGGVMSLFPAVLLALLYVISCKSIAAVFCLELSWMALAVTSVPVFFVLLSSAPKGFLMGVTSNAVILIGQIIESVLCIAGLIAGAELGKKYGVKVAALLKSESMIYGYGAFGAMAGLALGSAIIWILWMILYIVFRRVASPMHREDNSKRLEDTRTCLGIIFNSMYPITLAALLTQGIVLLLLRLFMLHPGMEEGLDKVIAFGGCFYGKYLPLMMIPMVISAYNMTLHNSKIMSAYEKDDGRQLRDRLERGIVKLNAISISGAIFTAILGQAFADVFFAGMTASVLKMITATSVLIVCYCYFHAANNLLHKMLYSSDSVIILALTFSVSAIISYLLLVKLQKGLVGVAVSLILFYLIGAVAACARLYFITRVRINLIRCYVYPILAAVISGVIVLFINRLLFELAGAATTLLVGLLVGVFVDIFLLMAFHVVTENQIRNIPGGFIIVAIGRGIGAI